MESNGYPDHAAWRRDWRRARSSQFFCVGSKDEAAGNQTCTRQPDGPWAGGAAANYWAISATARHPDAAWRLLRWMSTEPPYQRFLMKAFLFPPALNALMPEWAATAIAVAQGLQNRGLQWFTQSGDGGWGRAEPWFAQADAQAIAVDQQWWQSVLARRASVREAFAQADQQVDALQASCAASQQSRAAAASRFPTAGPAEAQVPAGI